MKFSRGSVRLSLTPCLVKVDGRTYRYHRLRYWQDGKLHRPVFKTLAAGKAAAEAKLQELSEAKPRAHHYNDADAAALARARQLLATLPPADPATDTEPRETPVGGFPPQESAWPIELVASEYVQARQLLPLGVTLQTAAQDYARTHPVNAWPTFAETLKLFLARKAVDNTGSRYQEELRQRLNLLAGHISGPLARLTAIEITALLDRLGKARHWSAVSRNHYRAALSNLATFARAKGHIPRQWDEVRHVEQFTAPLTEITIWTPEETSHLFAVAQQQMPEIVPALVLMFFMGHRSSEVVGNQKDRKPPVDWRDLRLSRGIGYASRAKVRTASSRVTHIPPNARAWLRLYAKPAGPVCPFKNLNNQLAKLSRRAGLKWKKNSARRSYTSYRRALTDDLGLVSRETGTQMTTLQKYYLRPEPLTEARKYFKIMPPEDLSHKLVAWPSQKRAKTLARPVEAKRSKQALEACKQR